MILRDLCHAIRRSRVPVIVRPEGDRWVVCAGDPTHRQATGPTHLAAVRMWLARNKAIRTRHMGIRAGEVWGEPRRKA